MSDLFKPYVHLFSSNLPSATSNVAMDLNFKIKVDPAMEYYWRDFSSNGSPQEYQIVGETRQMEIIGHPVGNPPANIKLGSEVVVDSNDSIVDGKSFEVPNLLTERKVTLTIMAGDGGGGDGKSTSYYIDADT